MQDEMPFDLSHYIINKNFRDLFSQPEKSMKATKPSNHHNETRILFTVWFQYKKCT